MAKIHKCLDHQVNNSKIIQLGPLEVDLKTIQQV
jgi:hypothetical protein